MPSIARGKKMITEMAMSEIIPLLNIGLTTAFDQAWIAMPILLLSESRTVR